MNFAIERCELGRQNIVCAGVSTFPGAIGSQLFSVENSSGDPGVYLLSNQVCEIQLLQLHEVLFHDNFDPNLFLRVYYWRVVRICTQYADRTAHKMTYILHDHDVYFVSL